MAYLDIALRNLDDRATGEAMTLGDLALAHAQRGRPTVAEQFATAALVRYQEMGYMRGIAQSLDNLGLAHMVAGDYARAVERYHDSLVAVEAIDDVEVTASGRHRLAQAYRHLRDFPRLHPRVPRSRRPAPNARQPPLLKPSS